MEIGELLAKKRKERGLTQLEVANAVGVSEATVSRWESGNIANMRRDRIAALANVLSITPAHIMGWGDEDRASLPPAVIKETPTEEWGEEGERAREIRETMEVVEKLPEREQRIVLESVLGMVDALEKARDV